MAGECLYFANSLYNMKKYHVNFRTLIVCLLIFNSMYFILVFLFEIIFIITGNYATLNIVVLIIIYLIYGGIYYLQSFIFIERIFAVCFISRYELTSSKPPYIALIFVAISFGIAVVHIIFTENIFVAYKVMNYEVLIFTILAVLVYHHLYKKEIRKRENDFLKYLNSNLSFKYQYHENQKTYNLTINLHTILLIFDSLGMLSSVMLESFSARPDFHSVIYLTIFVLSVMKIIPILYVLKLNEPKMKLNFINLFYLRGRRYSDDENNVAVYVSRNSLESANNEQIYFYQNRCQRS
uniref:Serpentine receptor class gamma n=1 Tax=Strongyloides venezuelensis TaxID=75913 RepID=A0A0K0EWI4_STRVS